MHSDKKRAHDYAERMDDRTLSKRLADVAWVRDLNQEERAVIEEAARRLQGLRDLRVTSR